MVTIGRCRVVGQRKASLPGTDVDSPVKLSCDGSLIYLNALYEFLRLATPTVFLRIPDGIELGLSGLDAFLQAFNLVNRQPRLSEEQIAHGDIEIPLSLERTSVWNAWILMPNSPSRLPKFHFGVPGSSGGSLVVSKGESEGSHPLVHQICLGLKMLGYSVNALFQPIRQLAPVTPPTHRLVHLVQDSESSSQPRKIGLIIRR